MNEVKFERLSTNEWLRVGGNGSSEKVTDAAKDREVQALLRQSWYMRSEYSNTLSKVELFEELETSDRTRIVRFRQSDTGDWHREDGEGAAPVKDLIMQQEIGKLSGEGWYFQSPNVEEIAMTKP